MRKYVITVLFAILLAASAGLILMPADRASIEAENREMHEIPQLSLEAVYSGEFASDFDAYINDNVGFRGKIMEISRVIQSKMGFTPKLVGKVVSTTSDIGIGETLEGSLVIIDGRIMEMFSKKPDIEAKYADALNNISNAMPDNIKMYSMLVPTQLEFAEPMFANAQDSQKSCIDNISSMLNGDITAVDVYTDIKSGMDNGDDLYFKTDHHWNMDGSYCGYTSFADAVGIEPVSKSDFERKYHSDFFGALYQKANTEMDVSERDKLYYYDTSEDNDISIVMKSIEDGEEYVYGQNAGIFDETKDDYMFFMGGDNPLVEITNNAVDEGKTLVVIKDSYANAMIPWLINNYHKIIMIDPRSYKGDLYEDVTEYGADELLVINYVFTTTFGDYCDMLNDMVK